MRVIEHNCFTGGTWKCCPLAQRTSAVVYLENSRAICAYQLGVSEDLVRKYVLITTDTSTHPPTGLPHQAIGIRLA
jgi:hypothetical protein